MYWGECRVCTSLYFWHEFVWKKWRGLRYGNFYVGGANLGTLCVASMSLSSTGNVCLCAIWLVRLVQTFSCNPRSRNLFEWIICFVSGQGVGGGTCVFFGRGMCVWKQVFRDVEILNLILCFSLWKLSSHPSEGFWKYNLRWVWDCWSNSWSAVFAVCWSCHSWTSWHCEIHHAEFYRFHASIGTF